MSEDVVETWFQHDQPVWNHLADFVIASALPHEDDAVSFEQLRVRKLDESVFENCVVPFLCYDLALGDIVSTHSDPRFPRLGSFMLHDIVQPSGRGVARIWFSDDSSEPRVAHERKSELTAMLQETGFLFEWWGHRLVAVDLSDHARMLQLRGMVGSFESRWLLEIEVSKAPG
ncbi:DUF4265 domain-containing protein [Microcella sp.]|uniref:DUF4265 domain-containing protein n=1 Tax=Microcella sp. TaxID=1913979 RepID=UPI00391DAA69